MMPPLISTIIPVHNAGPWLQRCMDSICGQTLDNIEIICVNDASSDESGAIIDEYARQDERVLPITLGRNQGVSAARNIGMSVAQGKWLSFVDSDDALAKDFYEKLSRESLESGAEIIKGTCWDERDSPNCIDPEINAQIEVDKFKFDCRWLSAIYSANFILENKITFPKNCSQNEDLVFLYGAILNANRIKVVNDAIYYKFHIEGSLSSSLPTEITIQHILHARGIMLGMLNKNIKKISRNKYISEFYRIIFPLFTYIFRLREQDKDASSRRIARALTEYFKTCKEQQQLIQEMQRYDMSIATLLGNNDTEELALYLSLTQLQRLRYRTRLRLPK